jgi:hypothetical protein
MIRLVLTHGRRAVAPRFRRSPLELPLSSISRHASLLAQLTRSVASKEALNANPTVENTLNYCQNTVDVNPKEVITLIEKGWGAGKFPVNNEFCTVYFRAAAKLNKLSSINYTNLLALLAAAGQKGAAGTPEAMLSQPEIAALVQNARMSATAAPAGGAAFGAGQSSTMPLHIQK